MDDMGESGSSQASAYSGQDDGSENEYDDHLLTGAVSLDYEDLREEPGGDENAMGKLSGDPYTAADDRLMAKYITTFDNWNSLTGKERWTEFTKRVGSFPIKYIIYFS